MSELIYSCLDCKLDTNSVICAKCFEEDKHKGHRVVMHKAGGGCCDCGDDSAWMVDGFCSRHAAAYHRKKNATEEMLIGYIPPEARTEIQGLAFAIIIFAGAYTKSITAPDGFMDKGNVIIVAIEFLLKVIDDLGDGASRLVTNIISYPIKDVIALMEGMVDIDADVNMNQSLLDFLVSQDIKMVRVVETVVIKLMSDDF